MTFPKDTVHANHNSNRNGQTDPKGASYCGGSLAQGSTASLSSFGRGPLQTAGIHGLIGVGSLRLFGYPLIDQVLSEAKNRKTQGHRGLPIYSTHSSETTSKRIPILNTCSNFLLCAALSQPSFCGLVKYHPHLTNKSRGFTEVRGLAQCHTAGQE